MIKFGEVVAYDAKTQKATIRYVRPDACAKCGACGSLNQSGEIVLKADCAVGNWVRVALPDEKFVTASALAYALPLGGLAAGLLLGYFLSGKSDLMGAVGAVLGMGVTLLILRAHEKKHGGKPEWTPHVDAVYPEKPDALMIGCGGGD